MKAILLNDKKHGKNNKIAILLVSIALAFVGISPLGDGEGGAIPIDDSLPF